MTSLSRSAVTRLAWTFLLLATTVIPTSEAAASGTCSSLYTSVDSIWPVARSKAASTVLDTGLNLGKGAPTGYPQTTVASGQWATTDAQQWTSGFLSSYFWQMAALAGRQASSQVHKYRSLGQRSTLDLSQGVTHFNGTHDVGFLIYTPYRNAQANGGATSSLKAQMLKGAAQRFTRYNPKFGKYGGFPTASSSLPYPKYNTGSIIDDMMNLEIILGASVVTGRCDYFNAAINHARSEALGHVKSSGFVYHSVVYNKLTGDVVTTFAGQGASKSSDWSRGHAWALYGFTMVQRYMRGGSTCARLYANSNPTVLTSLTATTVSVADRFLANLPSTLQIPPWDFSVTSLALVDRDTSAAAIAASGLIELDGFVPGKSYFSRAARIIRDLSSSSFLTPAQGSLHSILEHGTLYRLHGSFNTGTIWGDYFLLEALNRGINKCSTELATAPDVAPALAPSSAPAAAVGLLAGSPQSAPSAAGTSSAVSSAVAVLSGALVLLAATAGI